MTQHQKPGRADVTTPEAGPTPPDAETTELSTRTQPRSAGLEDKSADDAVEVEFLHHHQAADEEAENGLVDYVPGQKVRLPAGQARQLVAGRAARYTDE